MRLMAFACQITPDEYEVRTPSCYGCMRFNKLALKEKSAFFRTLNSLINPYFDAMIERILTVDEMLAAKAYAQAAMTDELETT
jgi:hypothetical protein